MSIWEDFKLPLMIIGGLLVYFIPTLLGMRMNDFKKVFFINLFLGCTVGLGLAALHIKPFPEQAEQVIFCKRGECQAEGGMDGCILR